MFLRKVNDGRKGITMVTNKSTLYDLHLNAKNVAQKSVFEELTGHLLFFWVHCSVMLFTFRLSFVCAILICST